MSNGEKNIHSLTGDSIKRLSPCRGEIQRGAFDGNAYSYIHYDIPCLTKGITGFMNYFIVDFFAVYSRKKKLPLTRGIVYEGFQFVPKAPPAQTS